MIQVLIDHWEATASLITAAFTVGLAWAALKRDIQGLATTIDENRGHMDEKFKEMRASCVQRGASCDRLHGAIELSIEQHGDDDRKHLTTAERALQTEWRLEMHRRFDRLEALILGRSHLTTP